MKKVFLILVLVGGFIISCSSDDNEPAPQVYDSIIGNWKLVAATSQIGSQPPINDLENCDLLNDYAITGVVNEKTGNGL